MSGVIPSHDVVVVREADAEILASGPVTGLLYADSSATGGALSSQRIVLRKFVTIRIDHIINS